MVEVYNESVYDLLVSPEEGHEKLQLQKKGNDVIVPVSSVICMGDRLGVYRKRGEGVGSAQVQDY